MPFIHSPCETYWGLRSVRSALQESDPLIYRPLIRLALWRFHRANDEISPSFWLSVSLLCQPALPSPGNSVSHSIPHWPPPSPHPALKLWCSSWGAHFCPTLPLGLHRGFYLSSEVIVDLSSAERWVCPRCMVHWLNTPGCCNAALPCITLSTLSQIKCTVLMYAWHVKTDWSISSFSSGSVCALCWVSHCHSRKSYSTGLGCFGGSDCAIGRWSGAALLCSSDVMKLFIRETIDSE